MHDSVCWWVSGCACGYNFRRIPLCGRPRMRTALTDALLIKIACRVRVRESTSVDAFIEKKCTSNSHVQFHFQTFRSKSSVGLFDPQLDQKESERTRIITRTPQPRCFGLFSLACKRWLNTPIIYF